MISPDTVRAVKERVDIVALVKENVRLRKAGRSFVGLCPFHHEKTPSFHVNPERSFYHCFGCGASGSAIDYVMQLEGLAFPEAVRALAERLGIPIEETASTEQQTQARRREQERQRLYQVNELAAAYFERQLRLRHPLSAIARGELGKRALPLDSPDEAIQAALAAFRVGYAPFGWDGLASELRAEGVSPAAAEALGLLVPRAGGSGHYDRFRHRLMFAVIDLQGRVVAFSGRALPEPSDDELGRLGLGGGRSGGAEGDRVPAKYINSPESPVYVKGETVFGLQQARHAIRQRDQAIVVEGNFDVLSLHARGIPNVVAPLGTAFTAAQGKLIARYSRNVVLLFDGDAAGTKAVAAARGAVAQAGLAARVASMPAGTDPDEFVRNEGAEALAKVVSAARGLLDHLIDVALSPTSFEGSSLRGKAARLRAVADLLAEESDPTLRAMAKAYADRLSAQLVVAGRAPGDLRQLEQMVREAFERGARSEAVVAAHGEGGPEDARPEPPAQRIAERVLGAILDFPELLDDTTIDGAVSELEGDVALGVAAVRRMWDPQSPFAVSEVLDLMPPAIHAFAASRLASPVFESVDEARAELLENAKKLRRRTWQREKAGLLEQLATAEQRGDSTTEDELLQELARRSRSKLGLT